MKRRIALDGLSDDALRILPQLASHPEVELVRIFDREADVQRRRVALYEPATGALVQRLLTDDPAALDGLELVSPAEAAALCDLPPPANDGRDDLLQALAEVADTLELARAAGSLHARLLDAAIAGTGATGGSLLLVTADALRIRASTGVEPELWPKVQLALGDGIAGRVWAEERACVVQGAANPAHFELARERHDVASALCLPLASGRRVQGVLCLHHATRADCFGAGDLDFAAGLGAALGRIVASAEAQAELAGRAARGELAAQIEDALRSAASLDAGLASLCERVVARLPGAAATLWWRGPSDAAPLRLAASSHAGGGLGAAAVLAPGEGLDGRAARDRVPVLLHHGERLAYAALPLLDADALLGVLAVQCAADVPPELDAEHWLVSLAEAAARALGRRLRDEQARARALRSEALAEASLAILATREPARIAEQLAAAGRLVLDAEHVLVRVVDAGRRRMPLVAPSDPALLDAALLALDRRAAREALRRREPIDAAPASDAPALLVVPLLDAGRALGTLGLYGLPAADAAFDTEQRRQAVRLAAVAARALAESLAAPAAAASALVAAGELERRLEQEIARAAAAATGSGAFALVSCRIENAAALGAEATALALERTAAALAEHLRPFDLCAESAPDTLLALLPEPGAAPAERVARLARAVAEAVAKEDDAVRVSLAFGHALYPDDGEHPSALVARALQPRIRML